MFNKLKQDPDKLEKFFHYLAYRYLRDNKQCGNGESCPVILPSTVNTFLQEIDHYIDNDAGFNKNYLPSLYAKRITESESNVSDEVQKDI